MCMIIYIRWVPYYTIDGKTSLGERESIFKANMTVDVVLPFINVIMKNYSVNV